MCGSPRCCAGGSLDGARVIGSRTLDLATNHLKDNQDLTQAAIGGFSETSNAGIGFGLGFAMTIDQTLTGGLSSGDFYWGGAASTIFWADQEEDLSVSLHDPADAVGDVQLPRQLKSLVYSAIEDRRSRVGRGPSEPRHFPRPPRPGWETGGGAGRRRRRSSCSCFHRRPRDRQRLQGSAPLAVGHGVRRRRRSAHDRPGGKRLDARTVARSLFDPEELVVCLAILDRQTFCRTTGRRRTARKARWSILLSRVTSPLPGLS